MPTPASLSALAELTGRSDRFLILSHVRPDGDAYGSTLGLGLCLQALGKDVKMANGDGLSSQFTFLPGSEQLLASAALKPEAGRVIIAVDCADQKRLGDEFPLWGLSAEVNIDHHVSNPGYGTLNLIDAHAPATAQVLYEIMAALEWPMTPAIAANLYVGLMTDTGSFRYRQTTARTMEIAARLVAAGADPTALAESCYWSFRAERLLLLREVLNSLHFTAEQRVAWFHLTPETFAKSGATPLETEGLIEYLQAVRTVEAAFLIEELDGGLTRASLRSRGTVDVQRICAFFGGGGHRLAAGLRTRLTPADLEKQLVALILEQLPN